MATLTERQSEAQRLQNLLIEVECALDTGPRVGELVAMHDDYMAFIASVREARTRLWKAVTEASNGQAE